MNALEKKFKEEVERHGDEIAEAYEKACEISEKYGIPFGSYVPKSFFKKFKAIETDDDYIIISARFVDHVCAMDSEWLSSTTQCEFGGY